jgi:hypothetical protein
MGMWHKLQEVVQTELLLENPKERYDLRKRRREDNINVYLREICYEK